MRPADTRNMAGSFLCVGTFQVYGVSFQIMPRPVPAGL